MLYCHKKRKILIFQLSSTCWDRYSSKGTAVVKEKNETPASLVEENKKNIEISKVNEQESKKKQKQVNIKHVAPKKHIEIKVNMSVRQFKPCHRKWSWEYLTSRCQFIDYKTVGRCVCVGRGVVVVL